MKFVEVSVQHYCMLAQTSSTSKLLNKALRVLGDVFLNKTGDIIVLFRNTIPTEFK
jgi:hypothetical protein